ncbi:Hypothetical predicted protein, partial [Prunus dulcis]
DLSSKREIGKGLERGGLYYLAPDVPSIANSAVASPSFNLWHWCLGHPSKFILPHLQNFHSTISIPNNHVCTICPLAKHCRLSFPSSTISTNACFDLIHCD